MARFELRFFNWVFLFGNNPSGEYSPSGSLFYPSPDPATRAVLASLGPQVRDYLVNLPLRRAPRLCAWRQIMRTGSWRR